MLESKLWPIWFASLRSSTTKGCLWCPLSRFLKEKISILQANSFQATVAAVFEKSMEKPRGSLLTFKLNTISSSYRSHALCPWVIGSCMQHLKIHFQNWKLHFCSTKVRQTCTACLTSIVSLKGILFKGRDFWILLRFQSSKSICMHCLRNCCPVGSCSWRGKWSCLANAAEDWHKGQHS